MSTLVLRHQEVVEELDLSWVSKVSLFLWGTFGIGKSFLFRAFAMMKAKELGLEFSDRFEDINDEKKFMFLNIVLHHYEPAELKGIPFPNDDRTGTIFLPMQLLPVKGQGIIVFDEMNLASQALLHNAYQVIEDRQLAFWRMPESYVAFGAGNKEDDRGNTFEIPMPLNNRFFHAELAVPTVLDSENEHGEVITGWLKAYALPNKVHPVVCNYLSYAVDKLHTYNPANWDENRKTCATPRMWDKVSRELWASQAKGALTDRRIYRSVAKGCGEDIAADLTAWMSLANKFDIPKIFAGQDFVAPKQHEMNIIYSLMNALIAHYGQNATDKNAVRLLELIETKFAREHQIAMLTLAKQSDDKFFAKLKKANPKALDAYADDVFKLLVGLGN